MNVGAIHSGRSKRWAPYLLGLTSGVAAICGVAFGRGLPHRVAIAREVNRTQIQRPDERLPQTCQGGVDYPAGVELVPDAVITVGGRESVEYHAEVNVRQGKAVGLAWDADVVDDRGRTVASKLSTGTAKAKAGDTNATGAIVARNLPDGYYMLRARVAVSADDAPATVMEAVQYVNVSGGKWREMDDVQWRANSNASLAFAATTLPIKNGGR